MKLLPNEQIERLQRQVNEWEKDYSEAMKLWYKSKDKVVELQCHIHDLERHIVKLSMKLYEKENSIV